MQRQLTSESEACERERENARRLQRKVEELESALSDATLAAEEVFARVPCLKRQREGDAERLGGDGA